MDTSLQQTVNSLGTQFRQAREALNLSIEDVAKHLNLRTMVIQAIENDEFLHKSIPVTFMKGYVRSYAKFLKLPDDVWQGAMLGLVDTHQNDLAKHTRSTQAVNSHSHNHRWIGYLTALILLAAVGMTGLWWWENHQQSNDERDNLVQNYVDAQDNGAANGVSIASTPASLENQPVATSQPLAVTTMPVADNSVTQTNNSTNNATVAEPAEKVVDNQAAVENNPVPVAQTLLAQHSNDITAEPVAVATESQPAAVKGDLHIEVIGDCWISIKNAAGKVLAQKQYKNGDVLDFDAGSPYSVIIGATGNVKITYKGENYPLKVDGRVAKFKLL